MENGNITMLNALDINSTDSTIKVKIIRAWKRMMNEDRNKCYSIEMILMDEEGNKIYASCLHKFFLRFENYLIQDDCLFIKRPSLAENKSNFKLVSNQNKVTFYFSTSVRKCNAWAGPKHGFHFSDFKSVLGKSSNAEDNTAVGAVIDIIGYVMICYPMEDTDTKLGSVKRINLKLKDLHDEVVSVTLWDDFALEMNAYMSREDRDKDVFLIIQFVVLKVHQEKRTLSNAYHATRLFINSDIADIQSFKKSYLDKLSSACSSSGEQSGSVIIKSFEDVFLTDTEFSPIAYVSLIGEEKYVVIVATIKGICNKKLWYYEGCNVCKCKVEKQFITIEKPDGSCDVADKKVFKCTNEKCNAEDINPIYRFKIPIIVQDSTGSVSLTLFNREAFSFLKKSADELVVRQEKSTDFEDFPPEFDGFIGKRFAFQIKVSNYNIDNNVEYFAVNKMTNDAAILSALEKKYDIGQNDDSQSIGAYMSEIQSNSGVGLKDAVSSTSENITPMSHSNEVVAKSAHADLKRNLDEIYDVEDAAGFSSTKPRTKDENDLGNSDLSKKLLVPKKEK